MKALMAILLFFSTYSHSQQLLDLFDSDIPIEIKNNVTYREMISGQLDRIAKINPELLYYYLYYLNARYNDKILDPTKNGLTYFRSLEKRGLIIKNMWLQDMIEKIGSYEYKSRVKELAIKRLSKYLSRIPMSDSVDVSAVYEINTTKVEYYIAKYITNDSILHYDPNIGFGVLKTDAENHKYEYFTNQYHILSKGSMLVREDLIDEIIAYSFLFHQDPNNIFSIPLFILFSVERDYSIVNEPKYGIMASIAGGNFLFTKSKYNITPLNHSIDLNVAHNIPQAGIIFDYKIFLRDLLLPFSYLDIQAGYFTKIYKTSKSFDDSYHHDLMFGSVKYHENLAFKKLSLETKKHDTYYIDITTPAIIFGKTFRVEYGVGCYYSELLYELDYQYLWAKRTIYLYNGQVSRVDIITEGDTGPKKQNILDKLFLIRPIMNVKWYLSQSMFCQMNITTFNISMAGGISF